ncbi:MAG: Ribosomal RNA small subunit methyltransferase I [candidate division WS6 bacterium GW2011_GWF2_39_15]|uniref:Ribosomal RNA small subunit methyltransferase I n=1 Tax=candidate division WS6 bacterium GW2011_GWF2_39_15 TaxID=1619100 RepID=A0A0G0Q6Y0_9BACT|nr:MAG: Ribosomal RNA small subunit methyltransferase I [candidate division WS6 bacterium GW2011_GWF2_39_15]
MNKGTLFVVATPIGNLGDITLRAIETLKSVAFILAEDTRETAKLLRKYSIETSLVSYRDQNHVRMIEKVLEKLDNGLNLALVSDSGTPVISDPGFKLVRDLVSRGYTVSPIPGPNAAIAALSVSGVVTDKFLFLGFLPKSDTKRKEMLTEYGKLDVSLVIYESPQRLERLLIEISESLGDRNVVIANDITKLYELFSKKNVSEHLMDIKNGRIKLKGEFVVLIDKE